MNTQVYATKEKVCELKKAYTPETGEDIGYEKGAKMVKNYFDQNNDNEILSSFIGRNIIEDILAQPGVVGITMLSGLNELGQPKPVLVGVDSEGDYVLNVTTIGNKGEIVRQRGVITSGIIYSPVELPKEDPSWFPV